MVGRRYYIQFAHRRLHIGHVKSEDALYFGGFEYDIANQKPVCTNTKYRQKACSWEQWDEANNVTHQIVAFLALEDNENIEAWVVPEREAAEKIGYARRARIVNSDEFK